MPTIYSEGYSAIWEMWVKTTVVALDLHDGEITDIAA